MAHDPNPIAIVSIHPAVFKADFDRMVAAGRRLAKHQYRRRYGRMLGTILFWLNERI
jgi:hypothetical protein